GVFWRATPNLRRMLDTERHWPVPLVAQMAREGFACHLRIGTMAARRSTLGAAAQAAGKACSPSFLPSLSLSLPPSHVEGHCPLAARQAAFLFPTTSLAVSPRSALCSKPPSVATTPHRLGSRPGELDQYWLRSSEWR